MDWHLTRPETTSEPDDLGHCSSSVHGMASFEESLFCVPQRARDGTCLQLIWDENEM